MHRWDWKASIFNCLFIPLRAYTWANIFKRETEKILKINYSIFNNAISCTQMLYNVGWCNFNLNNNGKSTTISRLFLMIITFLQKTQHFPQQSTRAIETVSCWLTKEKKWNHNVPTLCYYWSVSHDVEKVVWPNGWQTTLWLAILNRQALKTCCFWLERARNIMSCDFLLGTNIFRPFRWATLDRYRTFCPTIVCLLSKSDYLFFLFYT